MHSDSITRDVPVLKFNALKGNRLLQRISQNNMLEEVSLADLNTTVLPQFKVGVSF